MGILTRNRDQEAVPNLKRNCIKCSALRVQVPNYHELASKLLVCGNGGNDLGCPVSFCMSGRYRFGVSLGAPYRFAVVLTYLCSLNSPPHYCTITVILTPAHILTQNLYYNYCYPNPKYLIIVYIDPLGR